MKNEEKPTYCPIIRDECKGVDVCAVCVADAIEGIADSLEKIAATIYEDHIDVNVIGALDVNPHTVSAICIED